MPAQRLTKPDEASASYFSSLRLNRYLVRNSQHGFYEPPTYYIPTNELKKAILAWHEKKLLSFGRSKRQEANDETLTDESTAYETAPEEDAGSTIAEIPRDDGPGNYRFRFMEPVILDNSSAVEELARDDEAGFQSIEFIETILLDSSETTFLPKSTAVQNLRPILPKPSIRTDGLSPPVPLPALYPGTPYLASTSSYLPRIDALNAIGPKDTIRTSTHPIKPTNAPTFLTNRLRAYPFAPAPPTAAKGPTDAETVKDPAQNFGHRPPIPAVFKLASTNHPA
ncbi:MAG: hypothetical protein LQ349_004637 [Xanthoria aureola]|nr:MAG: hypothetical protein LQ349_004637 [Xanthoria aureola]